MTKLLQERVIRAAEYARVIRIKVGLEKTARGSRGSTLFCSWKNNQQSAAAPVKRDAKTGSDVQPLLLPLFNPITNRPRPRKISAAP